MTDQLEIIAPSGAIEFFPLDAATGITAIGRAQANDVRLADSAAPDYAAVIDHRAKPFSVMALQGGASVRVNGQPLAEQASHALQPWDSIEIGAYVLILADESAGGAHDALPVAAVAAAAGQPPQAPRSGADYSPYAAAAASPAVAAAATPFVAPAQIDNAAAGGALLGPPIPALRSDLIDLRMSEPVHTVDAGVPATWEVTVTNASTFVGDFEVRIAGYVLDKWVSIVPERFTMSVRESRTVVVTLHPDREPASLAGVHHFVIEVLSRSLHGLQQGHVVERASIASQLIINPFYDLSPSPVYPPETVLKYRQRTALLTLPIYNGGNSVIQAMVSGRDDADDCRVEFPDAPPTYLTGGTVVTGPVAGAGQNGASHNGVGQNGAAANGAAANGAAANGAAANGAAANGANSHTIIEGDKGRDRGKRNAPTFPDTQPVLLEPGKHIEIPILVTPRQRRFIGGKASIYRISIVTTPPQSLQALGVQPLVSQPRVLHETFVGRWVYALLALLLAIIAILVFRPNVRDVSFHYVDVNGIDATSQTSDVPGAAQAAGFFARLRSRLPGASGEEAVAAVLPDVSVRAGQPVTVSWSTRNGSELVIYFGEDNGALVTDDTERAVVRNGSFILDTQLTVSPEESAQALAANTKSLPKRFTLSVSNWITAIPLIGRLGTAQQAFIIDVVPALPPSITSFTASSDQVIFGTPEALSWITNLPNPGDEVMIRERTSDSDVLLPPLPASGTLVITPQADTRYDLVVNSRVWITSTPVPDNLAIGVRMPTPEIRRLSVAPAQIVAGQAMTVSYEVQASDERILVIDRGIATEEFVLNAAADSIAIPVQTPGPFNLRLRAFRFPPGSTARDNPSTGSNQLTVAGAAATPTFTPTPTLPPTPTSTLSPTPTPVVPMIEVLALTPNEIVLGDPKEVLLTWQVIGDADQIQISAPDFAVTTADKKGSISVPRDKHGVFVMTVLYKGEAKASKSAELKVLDPTPTLPPTPTEPPPPPTETPTPTPTGVPNPRVVAFGIEAVPPAIKSIDSNGIDVYNVDGGAEMTIKWDVADATGADLIERSTTGNVPPITNRLPVDQVTMLATSDSSFELQAYNNPTGADLANPKPPNSVGRTSRSIRVVLNAARHFDPPTNVNFSGGLADDDPLIINWSYNPEQTDGILGFRVYRAPINSNDFVRIANETVLNNLARQYTDAEGPFCDRTYFVVAVYQDLTRPGADKTAETDAGTTSFLTQPCP